MRPCPKTQVLVVTSCAGPNDLGDLPSEPLPVLKLKFGALAFRFIRPLACSAQVRMRPLESAL